MLSVPMIAVGLLAGGDVVVQAHTASPAVQVATPTQPPTAGMHRVLDDGFAGLSLDGAVWDTCYPWAPSSPGCTNWGNDEREWYLPSQDVVSGGELHLVSQGIPTEGTTRSLQPQQYPCRSGMVTTYPGLRFTYGYVQVRAKLPAGPLWSAIWLVASNFQWPPEIDIAESWSDGTPASFLKMGSMTEPNEIAVDAKDSFSGVPTHIDAGWHTYGLLWTAKSVTWYLDGRPIARTTRGVPDQSMYLVIDLADASSTVVTPSCNGSLDVRRVQVWQRSQIGS
ncbi:MAG TPA: glycoside hydrolase family 16 protein [Acidimicrobiales bacterium]